MSRSLRHLLVVMLATVLVVGAPAPDASASSSSSALDITFPTVRTARFSNDYFAARSGGRTHGATDLFAAAGSPIFAAHGGTVVWAPANEQSSAGFALWIRDRHGRTFAYYHLGRAGGSRSSAIASGLHQGARVRRGQRIGWLGDSGNAAGGTPHLHFEIHNARSADAWASTRLNPYASLLRALGRRTAPSASRSRTTSSILQLGSSGPRVVAWQRLLNRVDDAGLTTDGAFGTATHAATVRFQRSAGIGPSGLGIVGPRTRAAMQRRQSAATTPPTRSGRGGLQVGSSGPAVKRWQRHLNRVLDTSLTVDGAFGPATRDATIRFQRSAGLGGAGLGTVGPRTRAAMGRRLASATARPTTVALQQGARGAAVVRWQRQLNRVQRSGLVTDGIFGPGTHAATVRFQRSAGLGPDGLGIVGPRTRAAMARRLR